MNRNQQKLSFDSSKVLSWFRERGHQLTHPRVVCTSCGTELQLRIRRAAWLAVAAFLVAAFGCLYVVKIALSQSLISIQLSKILHAILVAMVPIGSMLIVRRFQEYVIKQ